MHLSRSRQSGRRGGCQEAATSAMQRPRHPTSVAVGELERSNNESGYKYVSRQAQHSADTYVLRCTFNGD
eukprot:7387238-Prymnesium_polylepis.1